MGKAIKAIRLAQGHQANKFATACLISDSTLHNIESGHRQPSPELLIAIARQLGVDVDAIAYELVDPAATGPQTIRHNNRKRAAA